MKYNETNLGNREILANDDWAGIPHTFSTNATAGDLVENTGVCLYDVNVAENPNGTCVYRGIIRLNKLAQDQYPTAAQVAALPLIRWLQDDNTFYAGKTV